jgi:hypothetical protein
LATIESQRPSLTTASQAAWLGISAQRSTTPAHADDGGHAHQRATLPPARVTVGKNVGLHVSWYVYRGKGAVTFSPEQIMSWEDTRAGANSPWAPVWVPPSWPADGKVTVWATFSEPGEYVLRSRADDGALTADGQVTITVTR